MSDSHRGAPARGATRLIPGVIYEWTPEGIAPTPDDTFGAHPGQASFRVGDEPITGYRLAERIGRGCTGEVWEAIGPGGVAVALKFVEGGPRAAIQEPRTLAAMLDVRHANLITICGIWERDDWTAIGMDLADGSLLDRFEAARAAGALGLEFAEAVDLLRQAARGIDFLNEPTHVLPGRGPARLIHRDIKPQNLLVVGASVKVGDFGLVRRLDIDSPALHRAGDDAIESLITAYSAPEVRRGGVSARSDQYSLAATYCYLRGGRPPATPLDPAAPIDLMMLPAAERPAVARALAIDPAGRWPDCSTFVEALAASAREVESPTRKVPALARPTVAPLPWIAPDLEAWTRSRGEAQTAWRAGALVAGLLVLAGLAWLTLPGANDVAPALAARPPAPVEPPAPAEPVEVVAAPRPEVEPDPARVEPAQPTDPATRTAAPVATVEPAPVVAVEPGSTAEPPSPPADLGPIPTAAPEPSPVFATVAPVEPGPPIVAIAPAEPSPISEPIVLEPVIPEEPAPGAAEVRAVVVGWLDAARGRLAARVESARRLVGRGLAALPRPAPPPALAVEPVEPPLRTATIIVRLPSSKAELVVRGEVGRGNPDEWYGPRRVIHSPPLSAPQDYLIGTFWTDPGGRQMTRSQSLKVNPGRLYEVDLRGETPSAVEVPRPPAQ